MVHREITFFFFFIGGLRQFGEHAGNRGLQSLSIQLNCSNFWLSHITHHHTSQFQDVRFSWLSAANLFFACANLWIGIERRSKSIVLQMVLQIVLFFFAIYFTSKPTIYSTIFGTIFFFGIFSCSTHDMFYFLNIRAPFFSAFLRAPNRALFCILSCTISFGFKMFLFFCFFSFRAPYRVFLLLFFVHHIVFFLFNSSCTILNPA